MRAAAFRLSLAGASPAARRAAAVPAGAAAAEAAPAGPAEPAEPAGHAVHAVPAAPAPAAAAAVDGRPRADAESCSLVAAEQSQAGAACIRQGQPASGQHQQLLFPEQTLR